MASQVDPSLLLMSVDWVARIVTFHCWDGTVRTMELRMPNDYEAGRLRKITWSPPLEGFIAETTDGDAVAFEVPRFDESDQLNGRLCVYLDQCIWGRMANAQHDPTSVTNASELAAAQNLIELVEQRKVILPLSSGHHAETTRWGDNERRYRLGLTTLLLSRGWQMRDPLVLRREEFRSGLFRHVHAEDLLPPPSVFTLQPNATSQGVRPIDAPEGFPPEAAHMLQTLTYLSALVATILDSKRIEPTANKSGWVEASQKFSNWLDGETGRRGPQKRASVDAFFLSDIGQEIAEEAHRAQLSPVQMSSWIRGPVFRDMEGLPSIGIFRSVLQDRHLNVGTTWTANDLTDMVYLSAATGYADIVVAERHMTSMLRQAQRRLGRDISVYSSLAQALPAVRDCLAD